MTKLSHIILIDCTDTDYTSKTATERPLGGIQNATIALSHQFKKRGYAVTVLNNTSEESVIDGIQWQNRNTDLSIQNPKKTAIIANNNPNLFKRVAQFIQQGAKPYLWVHNTLNFKRFMRDMRWLSYAQYRPTGIFLSHDALKNVPFYYPFKEKVMIPHHLNDDFFNGTFTAPENKQDKVLFITHPHRGLTKAILLWQNIIHPAHKNTEFHIYANADAVKKAVGIAEADLFKSNIKIMPRCTHSELMRELASAKAMFYPGHKDETFCFAAAEAQALGVPVVTQGIGSLKERVIHNQTGFIEKIDGDFANALLKILDDDALQQNLGNAAKQESLNLHADNILNQWEDLLAKE